MRRALPTLLLAASLATLLTPPAAAAPVCAGASTGDLCVGAYVDVRFVCQPDNCVYVCVGIYNAATEHCTGLQLP